MPPILSWRMLVLALSLVAMTTWLLGHHWPAAAWFSAALAVWLGSGRRAVFQLRFTRRREVIAKVAARRAGGGREADVGGCYDRLDPAWRRLLGNDQQ